MPGGDQFATYTARKLNFAAVEQLKQQRLTDFGRPSTHAQLTHGERREYAINTFGTRKANACYVKLSELFKC